MKLESNKQQAKVLKNLSIIISLVVAFSLPIIYAAVSYQSLVDSLFFKAKIKGDAQSEIIQKIPSTWMYAENRISGVLKREPVVLGNEFVQILDLNGHVIVSAGSKIERWEIQRSYPLKDIDTVVGYISVSASLSDFYRNLFFVSVLGCILGLLVFLILLLLPIKALKRISEELYAEKERAEATLNTIKEAIFVSDEKGHLIYFNAFAKNMLGPSISSYINRPITTLLELTDEESSEKVESVLVQTLQSKKISKCRERSVLRTNAGVLLNIEELCTPVFDHDGMFTGTVLCLRDVTEAKESLKRQLWEISHDTLTGLVNRQEFEKRTTKAIKKAKSTGFKYVLLYMDLDRFKVINDSLGSEAGDELLKQLAKMINLHTHSNDTLARLGGDEFGLLLDVSSEEKGVKMASVLLNAVQAFQFFWGQKAHTLGISIGITIIDDTAFSMMDVLGQAATACDQAKEQGRQRYCIFKENDLVLAARHNEVSWLQKITDALKEDRFVLYHQTYKTLKNCGSSSLHLEVLIRMVSEDGEIISPHHFLPAAERYGLIVEVDRWVINKVLSEYHTIKERYSDQALVISINLSGESFNSLNLLDYIEEKISEYGVNPEALCFEITETAAIKNISSAIAFIVACKKIGLKFALDDFGEGASSFTYLKELPVDYLKIDGGFIKNIEHDSVDRNMTDTINKIAHIMSKKTVAEFAENEEIINILNEMGVDYAQGYGVCLPKPLLPDNKT